MPASATIDGSGTGSGSMEARLMTFGRAKFSTAGPPSAAT